MIIKKVYPGMRDLKKVRDLYNNAFSEEDQIPFWRLVVLALVRPSVELLAYYDGDLFCGFTFTISTDTHLYVNFFAVEPQLRSKGYGARMDAALKARFPMPLIGLVKHPVPGTAEYEDDVRRIKFWERCGCNFHDWKYIMTDNVGDQYIACTFGGTYDPGCLQEIFDKRSLSLGATLRLIRRKLRKK